jgi:hypothetical protein
MSERNLVQISFRRRRSPGTSMKWHRRKSERRRAKVALVRTLRDPYGADHTTLKCHSLEPSRCHYHNPDTRFVFRLLLKHVGRPWGEVQRLVDCKIGSGYMAETLRERMNNFDSLDNIWYGGEFWSSYCYGRSVVLFVNKEGILSRKDPWRNSRRTH